MEKSPVACAMEWSIRLEKGLRSLKTEKSVEALEEMGRQLQWWMSEPDYTFAEYKIFGLISGEDKLFLNAIFLRLADAFRFGNKQIKNAVVKLFLRVKRANRREERGILSTVKLDNHMELLSRVKEVFDKGDVEEKASALVLFGCWAYFSKDCVDIRYIVLSSLVSGDVLVVKAALFAAGCFCELSDDFANVYLEMLSMVVLSQGKSGGVKLVGARAYGKSWSSYSLADKAYKTGLKLLMDSSEDDFSVAMLVSLSRIASRWMLLVPIQAELLSMFLNEEKSLIIQITSLRCHRFILERGACNFSSMAHTVQKLFGMLQRSELQPTLQLEALKILHKILLFHLSIIPCEEIPEIFLRLLEVVKKMQQSSNESSRFLSSSVLADILGKVLERLENVSGGKGPILAYEVITFVLDRILLLVTHKVDAIHQPESPKYGLELEVKNMTNTLNKVVEQRRYLHCLVLNNICLFIDKLMTVLNTVMGTEKSGTSNHGMAVSDCNLETVLGSKLMLCMSKVLFTCLQNLEETDAETNRVLDLLKVQVENACRCSYFDIYTRINYCLLLHLHSTICIRHMVEEPISPDRVPGISSVGSVLQLDIFTLDCAKNILGINSYWNSYKVGRNAACQGAWYMATLLFEELITVVQSSSCACWLKSLAQFSTSEKEVQLLLIPIVSSERNVGERGGITLVTNCDTSLKNLLSAWNKVVAAQEILEASDTGHIFGFQSSFLTLRAKFLKTVADTMKLLATISVFVRDGAEPTGQRQKGFLLGRSTSPAVSPAMHSSMEISYRMRKVARELDLLLVSFMAMDRQSVTSVSSLAFSCSILALTTGFAFLPLNLHASEEPVHVLLIEDLLGRLRHNDSETRKKLEILLKSFHNKNSHVQRSQIHKVYTYKGITLKKLCEYSVREIMRLQNEATSIQLQQVDAATSQILRNGFQLLSDIMSKLMSIPLLTPHRFFRARPAVLSEIFVTNEDGQTIDRSSILSGPHLSLHLCLQLKNMPAGLPCPLRKIYCIISSKTEPQPTLETEKSRGESQPAKQDQDIDEMMDLNEKLLQHIIESAKSGGQRVRNEGNDGGMVNEYVCFEMNERGQGLSSCLVDVSHLPRGGYYGIKWHSGGVDSEGCYWSLLPVVDDHLFTVCT